MRAWTTREAMYVRERWGKSTVDEMARALGRTWQSVYQFGSRQLGLGSARVGYAGGPWSREDEALLELLSMRAVPMERCGELLGRTAEACRLRTYEIKRRRYEQGH